MAGVVIVDSKGEFGHNGIVLTMEGSVGLQLSAKSVGMFEAFYNSIKVGILRLNLKVLRFVLNWTVDDYRI